MEREGSAAAAMLSMPGLVLLAVSDYVGELEQVIETAADLVGCPECGAVAELHDRRPCLVRDLPAGGRPVTLTGVGQAGLALPAPVVPQKGALVSFLWVPSVVPRSLRGRPSQVKGAFGVAT